MCGIHASISTQGFQSPSQELQTLLCNRGPDHIGHERAQINHENGTPYWISLTSTVLALRGGLCTRQPFIDLSTRSVLCWNGEAWTFASKLIVGNDGQAVFNSLIRASSSQMTESEAKNAILKVLQSISGPFAFVFLDKVHGRIYFGRDRLGRRSLLYKNEDFSIEFASIADSMDSGWREVEADGIYQISCCPGIFKGVSDDSKDRILSTSPLQLLKHSWDAEDSLVPSLGALNRVSPSELHYLNLQTPSIRALRYQLCESLKLRVLNVPVPPGLGQGPNVRVAILFSGGLDCTVLARMAHDLLPSGQHVDLINVAFENPRVIQAAKKSASPRKPLSSDAKVQVDVNPRVISSNEVLPSQSPFESCPDRETGRKAFQELQDVCPSRVWRFVAVNVPYTETVTHRANVVSLIYPHNTEMDLSIAYALYFAARGTGIPASNQPGEPAIYTTPARVLLSGLGADELFGGYTRHATAFNRKGYEGLLDELELDVNRLGKRNLGRDDRVISHWRREARFPYLDEFLVKWAVECPIWEKCAFGSHMSDELESPKLEPGKKVLRLLAYELGMHSVAQEKKRAVGLHGNKSSGSLTDSLDSVWGENSEDGSWKDKRHLINHMISQGR